MRYATARQILCATFSISIALVAVDAAAQSRKPIDPEKARVVEHWTKERRAAAIPRDLVIDERGLGYLRRPDKTLVPYGHDIAAQERPRAATPSPFAKPVRPDTTPPAISAMNPASDATIAMPYTFSATVKDQSGVASVTFHISGATPRSVSAVNPAGSTWTASVSGLADGGWSWWVEAKDASTSSNVGSSSSIAFTVGTSTGGSAVTNAQWPPSGTGGTVQTAAGRIYFEMPNNKQWKGPWTGYVCSGTVATDDNTPGRSIILTAAHCVYDDVNGAFARNVMFIPNQSFSGTKTDRDCGNDWMGCWVPSFGVVDVAWTQTTFPNNIPVDYAFYVVSDADAHTAGLLTSTGDALDVVAGSLQPSFDSRNNGVFTYALGYSYSDDPKFMYCAEGLTTESKYGDWWLGSCGLSGGSSGGPWVQPMTVEAGSGPIISVNSWGYTNSPGMGGPKLFGNSAANIFAKAKCLPLLASTTPNGYAGVKVTSSTSCPSP